MPPAKDSVSRAERERWARERDRERLRALQGALKAARGTQRERTAQIRAACKAERDRLRAEAERQRQELAESIRRMQSEAKKICSVRVDDTRRETSEAIARAVEALGAARAEQTRLSIWTRPAYCAVPGTPRRRGEQRAESDCEVAQNLTEAALLPVWEQVKHKIKASARRSRTEAFLEWVHEHAADVAELQRKAEDEALRTLIREEQRTRERLSVGYRKTTDRELERLAAGSSVDALPTEAEPPRIPMKRWLAWLVSGAGAEREWSYLAHRAGVEDAFTDRGQVRARNATDAARLAAAHLAEHHQDAGPFPAWLWLTDRASGAEVPFYARSPAELFFIDPGSDDRALYATEADRLRREEREERAELERAELERAPKKKAKRPRKVKADKLTPELVTEAAQRVEVKPGWDRAYIVDAWNELGQPEPLDDFKERLWQWHRAGRMRLSRAELMGVLDRAKVEQSAILRYGAEFNFIGWDAPALTAPPPF